VLVLDSNTLPTPRGYVQCSPGKYNGNALMGVCLTCPLSGICFNGAPPLFDASKVAGVIELELVNDVGDDTIKRAITAEVGVEFWQIQVLSSQGRQWRSVRSILFELVTDKTLMAALVQRIAVIGVSLGAIQAVGNLAGEGEVWVQVAGRFLLKSCTPGRQLINTTDTGVFNVDTQKCRPCGVTTYIIDQMHGCMRCPKGTGNPRNCQICPSILFLENPAAMKCVCVSVVVVVCLCCPNFLSLPLPCYPVLSQTAPMVSSFLAKSLSAWRGLSQQKAVGIS
jgi:hypothetical protein